MPAAPGGAVRLCVLGPVTLDRNGRAHRLSRAQTRGLLGLLAVHAGRQISLFEAKNALWGDAEPASARAQLHTAVSTIRRQLTHTGATMTVEGGFGGYRLRPRVDEIDLDVFDRYVDRARTAGTGEAVRLLREALSMWQGEPLADASGDFVEPMRANLTARKLEAVEQLADLQLLRREHVALTRELEPFVAAHPLRETLRCRLLQALHRSGRQSEALLNIGAYREMLVEAYGLDPGAELVALELAIRRNEPAATEPASVTLADPPTPWQLPPEVATLVGRQEHLDTLSVVARQPSGGRIALVTGAPGVGKTALAVRWGHAAQASFPDGAVFIDLHGFGRDRPLAPVQAAHRALYALGADPGRLPDDIDDASALLRSYTAARRALLILDNARSAEQVRPLLPGTGTCMVVVTSRDSLPGLLASHDVPRIDLPMLSPTDGLRLLSVGLRPGRAAAALLVERCGGLPLALCTLAAILRDVPDRSPQGFLSAEGLAAFDIRGDTRAGVRSVLTSTYAVLPEPAQRLFRLVGTLPGAEFGLAEATAADGRDEIAVRADLESLLGLHLLDQNGPGQFVVHPLTRAFAGEIARTGLCDVG
jgi:DNA-binding SARP family transcriptional activator